MDGYGATAVAGTGTQTMLRVLIQPGCYFKAIIDCLKLVVDDAVIMFLHDKIYICESSHMAEFSLQVVIFYHELAPEKPVYNYNNPCLNFGVELSMLVEAMKNVQKADSLLLQINYGSNLMAVMVVKGGNSAYAGSTGFKEVMWKGVSNPRWDLPVYSRPDEDPNCRMSLDAFHRNIKSVCDSTPESIIITVYKYGILIEACRPGNFGRQTIPSGTCPVQSPAIPFQLDATFLQMKVDGNNTSYVPVGGTVGPLPVPKSLPLPESSPIAKIKVSPANFSRLMKYGATGDKASSTVRIIGEYKKPLKLIFHICTYGYAIAFLNGEHILT